LLQVGIFIKRVQQLLPAELKYLFHISPGMWQQNKNLKSKGCHRIEASSQLPSVKSGMFDSEAKTDGSISYPE